MRMPLLELCPIHIHLGNAPLLWHWCRGRLKFLTDSAQGERLLTKIVTRSKAPAVYFTSVGEADWVVSWLTRLIADHLEGGRPAPKISRLVVKHVPLTLATEFEMKGLLAPGFARRLEGNLGLLREDAGLRRLKIGAETEEWSKFPPPFHGHLYNDWAVVARWTVDDASRLHVRTQMCAFHRSSAPVRYEEIKARFEEDTS